MRKINKLKESLDKILKGNTNKKILNIMILGLIGIALALTASMFSDKPQNQEQSNKDQEISYENSNFMDYETKLKDQLEKILGSIEGVGKVDVMVTISNESEAEIVFNTTQSNSVTQEKDNQGGERVTDQNNLAETAVMVNENGENTPFVTRKNRPEIKGIMVVADGANVPEIKYKLSKAVETALDLPSYKVVIYARKK